MKESCLIPDVGGSYERTLPVFYFNSDDEGLRQCPSANCVCKTLRRHETLKKCIFPTFGSHRSKNNNNNNSLEVLSSFYQLINILLIFHFQQFNLVDVPNLHRDNILNWFNPSFCLSSKPIAIYWFSLIYADLGFQLWNPKVLLLNGLSFWTKL